MLARTRAQAIEGGARTALLVDTRGDSIMILAGGNITENIRVGPEMGVDIQPDVGVARICMTPRGFADPDCNSFSSTLTLTFNRGSKQEQVEVLPMGQVRW
jgi:hypothetical protein